MMDWRWRTGCNWIAFIVKKSEGWLVWRSVGWVLRRVMIGRVRSG